jgi:hypothetical protein
MTNRGAFMRCVRWLLEFEFFNSTLKNYLRDNIILCFLVPSFLWVTVFFGLGNIKWLQ